MKGYGQFCPVAKASEILTERWTPLVIRELVAGSHRFNEIHRGVPLMSRGLLSRRLHRLVEAGVLEHRTGAGNERGSYHLTPAGAELAPLIEQLGKWGARWARSRLEEEDLDATLLMWDVRRQVQPERFPQRRVVVAFEFLDAPRNRRFWWLISERDEVDLCAIDPGFEIDLRVRGSLKSLTSVWIGNSTLDDELVAGNLELLGERELCRSFPGWLALSPFAHVAPADAAAAEQP